MIGLSANLVWGGVNSLQLVGSLALFSVIMPENSKKIWQFVQQLVTFDMLYDIYELPDHMGFTETPFYNLNFCIVDYCSLGYSDALGSIAVIIVVTIIYWTVIYLIMMLAEKSDLQNKWSCCKPIKKRKGCCGMWKQDRFSIGNAIVRLLLENYITLLVAGGVAWYAKGTS